LNGRFTNGTALALNAGIEMDMVGKVSLNFEEIWQKIR
jgi:hypothetical protein